MYKIDLTQVQYPPKVEEKVKKEQEQNRNRLLAAGRTQEEVDILAPLEPWNALQNTESLIENVTGHYLNLHYFNKEKQMVVAPMDVRRMVAKINMKVAMSENGVMELSDEQMTFLLKVFNAELPAFPGFVYVADYLESVKIEQKDNN